MLVVAGRCSSLMPGRCLGFSWVSSIAVDGRVVAGPQPHLPPGAGGHQRQRRAPGTAAENADRFDHALVSSPCLIPSMGRAIASSDCSRACELRQECAEPTEQLGNSFQRHEEEGHADRAIAAVRRLLHPFPALGIGAGERQVKVAPRVLVPEPAVLVAVGRLAEEVKVGLPRSRSPRGIRAAPRPRSFPRPSPCRPAPARRPPGSRAR